MHFLPSVSALLALSTTAFSAPLHQEDHQELHLEVRAEAPLVRGTNIYWQWVTAETLIVTIIAPVAITTSNGVWDAFTGSSDGLKTIGTNLGRAAKKATAAAVQGTEATSLIAAGKLKALWKDTNTAILGKNPILLLNALTDFCSKSRAQVSVSQSSDILALGANGGPVTKRQSSGLTASQIQFCIDTQDMTGVFNNDVTPQLPDSWADGCPN